jgi:alanyl-tRNA synthetase
VIRSISSSEVVEIFLRFFEQRSHMRIPGHSLVPDNDPSLLFINSGMAPLKPYFLGQEGPPSPNLCNIQRCLRTNDIEEVGDRHHLTFFEMMGSWSIGNYWKEDAITLAWELLTKGFGFPPHGLYATVYRGDPELGIPADEASIEIWERVGMARDHIVPLGVDNFWGPAGDYGPCGPCTEVFFDTGDKFGERYVPGGHFDDVNRYIEIWNAGVFMEYNKLPSGLSLLEMRSVDTGSGLERILMTLNGFETVYETDVLRPLVDFTVAQLPGVSSSDKVSRLISDHIRATTMLLADDVKPAPNGPGYIPRRLIRRAIAAAYQAGNASFDFRGLLDLAISNAKSWNPHVAGRKNDIQAAFAHEQADFGSTLRAGIKRLEGTFDTSGGAIDGASAFTLFSTYGLPVDTIREFTQVRGGSFDNEGFQAAFERHQELSRHTRSGLTASASATQFDGMPATVFVGYDHLETTGIVQGIFRDEAAVESASAGEDVLVVVDRSSFYAESGGQVSDHGIIDNNSVFCVVTDVTAPRPHVFVHQCTVKSGTLRKGDKVNLKVDRNHRRRVEANHSATHLLHSALRKLLGEGVGQAGSLVDADRLRFDFTYPEKILNETLVQAEQLVNEWIWAGHPQVERSMAFDNAVAAGAMAFFADKYDATVRTITFGDISMELCGGTHVTDTADIGLFVIVSEGSIARGVRRIQAVTGEGAYRLLRERDLMVQRIAERLNTKPEDLEARIEALASRPKVEEKPNVPISIPKLLATAITLEDGVQAVIAAPKIPTRQFRQTALEIAKAITGIVVLAGESEDKAIVTVAVHASRANWSATEILAKLLPLVEGRGGGKQTLAEGSGSRVEEIPRLLQAARGLVAMAH